MAKSVFTCFQILKLSMKKWAQYPAQMEALIEPYPMRILRALDNAFFRPSKQQN